MGSIFRTIIRISAFVGKEIKEVLRQPRLIVTLVLGPFLILLLFGMGYQVEQPNLRTLFVVQAGNPLREEIQQRAQKIGPPLIYMGTMEDEKLALEKLRREEVDLVVIAPPDTYQSLRKNEQATFTLYHNQINPFQTDYINYLGRLYSNELNRQIAVGMASQAQAQMPQALKFVAAARTSNQALTAAMRSGDTNAARQQLQALTQNLNSTSLALGATVGLLDILRQSGSAGQFAGDPASQLAAVRQDTDALQRTDGNLANDDATLRAVQKQDQDLAALQSSLQELAGISSDILVSPFKAESKDVAAVQPKLVNFYTPAVIALLLQHLALTFAALSIVREYRLGSMELFRVSPLSAFETLAGKYLGYMIFGGVLAAILTALIVFGLGVPMLGDWRTLAGIIAALLFSSLGFGFVLSLLAQTESQAVQYSMIFLLTSIFFSGFFLRLDSLWEPIRVVSYLLPVTYAMPLLQNTMLRGSAGSALPLIGLSLLGVVAMLVAWVLLRRRIHLGMG